MEKLHIQLKAELVTVELLSKLDEMKLIKVFHPTAKTLSAPAGENIAEELYVSEERFGPHKLIAVGINKDKVRLGVHPDNEEFLIPLHGTDVKPVYLLICHLKEKELREKDKAGMLDASDFTCLDMYTAPRGAEMFTMLKDTIHCELTVPGEGKLGCFYVTEPRDLTVEWVDLDNSFIEVI